MTVCQPWFIFLLGINFIVMISYDYSCFDIFQHLKLIRVIQANRVAAEVVSCFQAQHLWYLVFIFKSSGIMIMYKTEGVCSEASTHSGFIFIIQHMHVYAYTFNNACSNMLKDITMWLNIITMHSLFPKYMIFTENWLNSRI